MARCKNHPEVETPYVCMKHNTGLCEKCLQCPDPNLYCKFRSGCPIYFLSRKGFDKKEAVRPPDKLKVAFQPNNVEVEVAAGTHLLDAAKLADIYVNASCNGNGSCGKCKLIVESGSVDSPDTAMLSPKEKEKGFVLACQATVTADAIVRIPEDTIEKKLRAAGMGDEARKKLTGLVKEVSPLVKKYTLTLDPPTLDDSTSDLERLKTALSKVGCDVNTMSTGIRVMRELTDAVRAADWHITVSVLRKKCSHEIVRVEPAGSALRSLGMAVDLGTTSIVVYLVDMEKGEVISGASGHNRQAACGDDVINRIVCAEKNGVRKLKKMAVSTINNLSQRALADLPETHANIENIVIAGNTTMVHLLLGIDARYIRREPYTPTVSEFPVLKAGEIGLKAAHYAGTYIMPGPAGYVGGDIVSGVLYTGMHNREALTLFIDVGTNGEIVLGSKEFLMTAACSAGPAFEGGGIRWGMRAEEGAIEAVSIDADTFDPVCQTVGDRPARGICGSGMIDLLSEMLKKGIIGQDGKFRIDREHARMTRINDEPAFILAFSDQADANEDIIFTESDIRSLILSKAAVYAGFTILMAQVGMDFSMVDQLIITGGFGQYLDIEKAVAIGLLPDIEREKFVYMGNSSIAGAFMALVSDQYRREAVALSNQMTYVDFSSNTGFMDEFVKAQFLPHTDANLFPSVRLRIPA
ncbi:MAG: DUF4445 domain-containing protein [Desulfobacter sp.]|nr:MAG: DUF4445 domain-containing protein [Desulfobacter sp.]